MVGAQHVLACVHRVAHWSLCSLARAPGSAGVVYFVVWGKGDGWPLTAFVWPGVLWWHAVSRRSISSMCSIILWCSLRIKTCIWFADTLIHFLLPLFQNSFPAAQLTFFPFNLPFHGQDMGTLMSFKGWLLGLPVVGSGISTCRIFFHCFCCFCDAVLLRHCCISEQQCVACEYHVIRTRFDDRHFCNSFSARFEVSGLW